MFVLLSIVGLKKTDTVVIITLKPVTYNIKLI